MALDSELATHIAARGDMTVNVETASGADQVSGARVTTWVERQAGRADTVQLVGPGRSEGEARPITAGLVPAGLLARGVQQATPPADVQPAGADPVSIVVPPVVPAPAVPVPVVPAPEVQVPEAPAPEVASEAPTLLPQTEPQPEPQNVYDMLWGDTRAVPIYEAPVREAPVNPTPEAQPAAVPVVSLSAIDDHDSMTIAQLPSELGFIPPVSEPISRTTVVAVTCALGHANPPHRTACRSCGSPLSGPPARIPRPSLGWVRSPDGERIELTSPIIVGRVPRADRVQGVDVARLLALPNGHISSNHLEIRLEGWNVLAVDLRSRNGTFLRRPGEPPMRLPDKPIILVAGDVLDLGHGVQLSFEELA